MAPAPPFETLAALSLFEGIASSAVAELARASRRYRAEAGEVIFREGDPGDALHVVEAGSVDVLGSEGEVLATIHAGHCFGEIALLGDSVRSATVRVREGGDFLAIPRDVFAEAVEREPALRQALGRVLLQRLPGLRAATSSIFAGVDHEVLKEIEAELRWVVLARGEALFHEGDPGDELFVLLQGRLAALLPGGRRREMGRGEVVGELALLGRAPRSATVVAERDSVLVGLSRDGFQRVVQHHPSALFGVAQTLVDRLRNPAGRERGPVGSIAVLSLLDRPSTERRLAQLARSLGACGDTRVLTRRDYLDRFPASSLAARDVMRVLPSRRWLAEQQADHRYVLFDVRADERDWQGLAISEADRILVLLPEGAEVTDDRIQRVQQAGPSRTWLLLCHDDHTLRPTGLAAWRERLPQVETFHVVDDFDGVVRRLEGRAVGLVLGGGGARAFAHIGLIRALQERGTPVDHVAGSSMGAMVGVALAAGMDWQQIRALALRVWAGPGMKPRWTLPVYSFFDVSRNERAVAEAFGAADLGDLFLPVLVTASDITTPALEVLDRGPVTRALRITGAFPGLAVPVPARGRLLVDGGMFNNLPIDVLQERFTGRVLACDVGQSREVRIDEGLTEGPVPRLRQVARHWNAAFPKLAHVLIRTVECCDALGSRERRELADHCFTPPVEDIALLDFPRLDEAIDQGYRHAVDAIEAGALDGVA